MMEGTQAEGLHLTGEYRRAWLTDEREGDDGKKYPGRWKVRMLADDRTIDVEYKDEASFLEALDAAGYDSDSAPERGTVMSLPVGVRAAKGYVFFFGRGRGRD